MTQEVIPSYLEFFKQRPQLLSVGKTKYEKIGTKTTIRAASVPSVIEFTAGADKEYYTDLNETYLMFSCRYVTRDGVTYRRRPTWDLYKTWAVVS